MRYPARDGQAQSTLPGRVHGLALLLIDGPLKGAAQKQVDALGQRLLDMVEKGL